MKELKDYLHFYIGQKCQLQGDDHIKTFHLTAYNYNYYREWHNEIRPILRRLSDMTEEEKREEVMVTTRVDGEPNNEDREPAARGFVYLLKQGFDLFNLIDEGLAIDAKTINH